MQSSRHRRHWLAVVAITATVGLGAGVLPQFATATRPHPRSLGAPVASATLPSSLPAAPSPSCAPTCDLYAKAGTVTAGTVTGIPIWGFTTDGSALAGGRLGGDPLNTIIISETDTLTLTLHNDLPANAGNLSLELPAAPVAPDLTGAAVGSTKVYAFGPLVPGTYVYQAGATPQQPRQLAMGLAAIIIVRPIGYTPASPSAYAGGLSPFDAEALVVMNEIDPAFNNATASNPLSSDVEDYDPEYFFINGKAHPLTDDIAAEAGTTVLLRAANLGIRDRALGLINGRLTLVGDDSHKLTEDHKVDLESKLLTPGQVADLTTLVDGTAPVGAQFALLDLNRHLNNDGEGGMNANMGGMLTFIDVVGTPVVTPGESVMVDAVTPATNDGTSSVTVDYTITGSPASASWFLDDLGGSCTGPAPAATGPNSLPLLVTTLSSGPCAPLWLTGDHVIWIQLAGGSASGDVFTLALQGPTVFDLSTDPEFANLSFNKTDPNPDADPLLPPDPTDVLLYGSANPSLLDRTIDDAEGCLSLPALPADPCPVGDEVVVSWADPAGPSHVQALSARIPVADFPTPNATNTVYVRVHETGGLGRWSGWGDPNSTVGVVIDTVGPAVSNYSASPNPAGAGNHPGNLNFLESVRIQVDISDALSPIADAELFLYAPDADGTGSQLRPLAGQWLDDLNAPLHDRTAYLEVAMAELMSQPQGDVDVYIHAKDAAGNWGPMELYTLQLDKTSPVILGTPVDVVSSHTFLPDETGMALAGGTITLNACDPNGVTPVVSCPLPDGVSFLGLPNSEVTSGIVEIRYHVAAITGQFGAAGAGIFYQTAQRTFGTITLNGDGTYSVSFGWHLVPQPPLPIDAASAVWVWAVDGAGNPSIPVEVPVGPPTP